MGVKFSLYTVGMSSNRTFSQSVQNKKKIKVPNFNRLLNKRNLFSWELRSADNVGRPFCCCIVFSLFLLFFISFPLSAFCDFSAICHRIFLKFGQLMDNNLYFSCIHLWMRRSKVKVTRWHTMKMHSQQKMWSMLQSPNGTILLK